MQKDGDWKQSSGGHGLSPVVTALANEGHVSSPWAPAGIFSSPWPVSACAPERPLPKQLAPDNGLPVRHGRDSGGENDRGAARASGRVHVVQRCAAAGSVVLALSGCPTWFVQRFPCAHPEPTMPNDRPWWQRKAEAGAHWPGALPARPQPWLWRQLRIDSTSFRLPSARQR